MPINNFRDDEISQETIKLEIIKRLLSYLLPYRKAVFCIISLMLTVVGINLLNPFFLKLALDHYIKNRDLQGLLFLGLGMAGLNLAALYCARQRIRIMAGVTNQILLTIRQELYTHIQKLPFHFFDSRPVGKILARIIGDVNSLNDLFTNSVTTLVPDLVTIGSVMVIMLTMHARLALAALLSLPLLMVFLCLIQVVSHQRWRIHRKKTSNLNAFTHENFSGIRVVQSFTAEAKTRGVYQELLHQHRQSFLRAVRLNDLFWPAVELSWGVGTIAVFWYGVKLLNTGSISIGLLVAFNSYTGMFWNPVMNISNFYNALISNLSGAERIFEIMAIDPTITDKATARILPPLKGEVIFNQVTFGYEPGQVVLDQISFKVQPGETIALVGPTGVGKTSIINLIARFYDTTEGAVLLDGYNVKEVTLESLRSQLGIVLQDTFLFSGTIRENIRYGRLDATAAEIEAAARAVHADGFICRLENGYETVVNERGSRLSFGQRQQIAFARALLADPRILILDEATAGIDTQTERAIQQGLETLLKGRTAFVIAHRLSTIRNADRIMVIDAGKIRECGNHEELLRKRGLYYQLQMAQYQFINEAQTS
ncbi:MAG: ABC transporter ATP-binding protein [Bacillota bacterium]|jgi:ATP-binding cassette subfamily B protein